MTWSTPPRKGRSTAGASGDDLEEAWLVAQAAKKSQARAAVWGVSVSIGLRGQLNSFVLLVLLLFVVLAVSVTTEIGNGAKPQAPTTVPPADDTGAGDDAGRGDQVGECDMSSGRWVYDDVAYPLYKESACKFMSDQASCEKFGRTDLKYQHWRWQPYGCNLPRFNAAKLLGKLRDKRLAFVGDSLNRNQWVSMICLIDTATPTLHKSMSRNGSLVSFKIHEYNASVEFYWSPLLVESNADHPVHHRIADRIVRAGSISKHARRWADADLLVFNSYLWWRLPSMKVLWGSFEAAAEGAHGAVYEVTDSLRAFELAIYTWAEWLELHVDRSRTRLFFMSTSPTHLRSDEWEAASSVGTRNHRCYNETEPIAGEGHRGRDTEPAFARAVEAQVRRLGARGVAVRVLNVTQLSEHRKDAHPSVHRRQWDPPTEAQVRARARDPGSDADCIHWCLPGVPDVWNQILYAHIVSS
ncbi:xylan O-acetyltransferase 14-like [Phragmites australis]|uniref:xylan O-acetyltransferase 14-like n=1 Tax=Phragmites australis TaxID=29695 RepID=UPI002D796DDA|nr:xylan O-acetyltransferase 14-like [Phragmites australis]